MKYIDPVRGVSAEIPVQNNSAFQHMTNTMLAWSPPSRSAMFECSEIELLYIEDLSRRARGFQPISGDGIGKPEFRGVPIVVKVPNAA